VRRSGGGCRVIMRDGVLLPGMVMPVLGPPPPDPHPNKKIQRMRDAWDMRIVAWDGVWPDGVRPRFVVRQMGMFLVPNRAGLPTPVDADSPQELLPEIGIAQRV
jgi:hypothetical protein